MNVSQEMVKRAEEYVETYCQPPENIFSGEASTRFHARVLLDEVKRLRAWCDQVGEENDFCAYDAHPGTICPKCNCYRSLNAK